MCLPTHAEEDRVERLHALMRPQPLGLRATPAWQANGIAFLIDAEPTPHGTLRVHVARANPVCEMVQRVEHPGSP